MEFEGMNQENNEITEKPVENNTDTITKTEETVETTAKEVVADAGEAVTEETETQTVVAMAEEVVVEAAEAEIPEVRRETIMRVNPEPVPEKKVKEKKEKVKKQKDGKIGKFFGRVAVIAGTGILFGLCAGAAFGLVNYYTKEDEIAETKFDMETYKAQIEKEIMDKVAKQEVKPTDGVIVNTGEAVTLGTPGVTSVVDSVMPSVVSIVNTYTYTTNVWGRVYSSSEEASGSGIIIGENDDEYLIATNNHVIDGAETLTVQFIDSNTAEAKVKGADADMDIAVIAVRKDEIDSETLGAIRIATLGDSDNLQVGETAIAIGNALGYGQSVTTGVISALNREIEMENGEFSQGFIQTDAAINPGNSGGALLNIKGEVIGINSNKIGGSTVEGMGYAIPISKALPIIDNLKVKKTKTAVSEENKGYLGISGRGVSEELSQIYQFPEGVYVFEVYEGTGADRAGIKKGDIITKFEGTTINSMEKLQENLSYYEVGETVELTVERLDASGSYYEMQIELVLTGADQMPSE